MAITALVGPAYYFDPPIAAAAPAVSSATNVSLNGTTRIKIAWIIQIPKTGNLGGIEFYVGFASAPSDVKFSFQDVSATGIPDGVVDQYRVVTGGSIAAGWLSVADLTSDGTNGGSRRAATQGDYLAVVMEWDSVQSGQVWQYGLGNNGSAHQIAVPYYCADSGAGFARLGDGGIFPSLALRYEDGSYAPLMGRCWPIATCATETYNSGSTPDERGLIFQVPAALRACGAWLLLNLTANLDVVLYDSDGTTPLATCTLDADISRNGQPNVRTVFFPASVELAAATSYRLAVKPSSGSNVSIYTFTVGSAGVLDAIPGGQTWHYTARTDAGAWSETTTTRPWIGLLIDGVETGGGGGGAGGAGLPAGPQILAPGVGVF